jgi:hypothetical protein
MPHDRSRSPCGTDLAGPGQAGRWVGGRKAAAGSTEVCTGAAGGALPARLTPAKRCIPHDGRGLDGWAHLGPKPEGARGRDTRNPLGPGHLFPVERRAA